MTLNLLTHRARYELARSVYRDIVNAKDYWYAFVGRPSAWPASDVPPDLSDNMEQLLDAQRNMLFLKEVKPIDVVFLTRRINWTSGVTYDRYDSLMTQDHPAFSGATTLAESYFYVMTDDYRVYKCLDNNGNQPSTVKPSTIDPVEPERPSDGYVWKFMFELPAQDITRFLTSDFIPVRYYTAEFDFDTNAFVNRIVVTNGGTGYTKADAYIIGDGMGAVIRPVIEGGVITDIEVIQQGFGYSHAEVGILGDGTGAAANSVLVAGDINEAFGYAANIQVAAEGSLEGGIFAVEIVEGGQDYVLGDTFVAIDGDGRDAVITVTGVTEGVITKVLVASEGANYTLANLTVTGRTTGFGAQLRAIMSPPGGHGSHAPKELFATNLCIQVTLDSNLTAEFAPTVFRQIGLVKNPKTGDGEMLYTGDMGSTCFKATVGDATPFSVGDEVVTNDGGLFQVVQKIGDTLWLLATIPIVTFLSTLRKNVPGSVEVAINNLDLPDADKMSGEIMYLNNRAPITRTADQDEIVQVFLRF
jgi:hypothetical protein